MKELWQLPFLPEQLDELDQLPKREQENRVRFREWLEPPVKAEIINDKTIMHSLARCCLGRPRILDGGPGPSRD